MKAPEFLSPMRLASLALAGSLFAASSLFIWRYLPQSGAFGMTSGLLVRRLLLMLPFIAGVAIALLAEWRLRRGIKANVWTAEELASTRRRCDSPVWIWLVIGIAVVGIVWSVREVHHHAIFGLLLFPLQTPMRLQQILKLPEDTSGLLNLKEFAPLHSRHWGQNSRDGSAQ